MSRENLIETINKFKIPIALSLVGAVLILGGVVFTKSPEVSYPKESIVSKEKNINVDISGAVINPGVYKLKEGQLIENAIQEAGGFSIASNKDYISKNLNLAQKLSDGMKIYVPFEGDFAAAGIGQGGVVAGISANQQVNINMTSQSELEALPGIGPVTAAKIISGRPYQKTDDLLNQKIVSKAVFEKIKSSIIVF
ncbi:hypothetical protein A3B39_02085 [Candidatus Daviesbacteria bacterium RIFCSPLOWO2_01_FULL_37_10]|nr:MAG: hypothetical protein A2111_03235 [Candidatus Daviesbacteria bacterium GWA1_38_6]OGE46163.1 MAG: hypothetical protein A3B39_02085 [Candidatus Daviesbacteria bacterium RIFCSPLOWO2_01_FULL_37_10]